MTSAVWCMSIEVFAYKCAPSNQTHSIQLIVYLFLFFFSFDSLDICKQHRRRWPTYPPLYPCLHLPIVPLFIENKESRIKRNESVKLSWEMSKSIKNFPQWNALLYVKMRTATQLTQDNSYFWVIKFCTFCVKTILLWCRWHDSHLDWFFV